MPYLARSAVRFLEAQYAVYPSMHDPPTRSGATSGQTCWKAQTNMLKAQTNMLKALNMLKELVSFFRDENFKNRVVLSVQARFSLHLAPHRGRTPLPF